MQLPFVNAFCTFFHQVAPLTYLLVILSHSGNRSLPRTGLLYTESTRGKEERKRVCACVWRRPTHRRCTLFYRNSSSNNSLQASRLLLFCVLCSVARNIHFESGKLLLRTWDLWVLSATSGNTGPLLLLRRPQYSTRLLTASAVASALSPFYGLRETWVNKTFHEEEKQNLFVSAVIILRLRLPPSLLLQTKYSLEDVSDSSDQGGFILRDAHLLPTVASLGASVP